MNRILEFAIKFFVFVLLLKFSWIVPNFWVIVSLILLMLL